MARSNLLNKQTRQTERFSLEFLTFCQSKHVLGNNKVAFIVRNGFGKKRGRGVPLLSKKSTSSFLRCKQLMVLYSVAWMS